MTDGKFDMNDVMAMMGGVDILNTKPVTQGRIIPLEYANDAGRPLFIGLCANDCSMKEHAVYEIQKEANGRLYLEEVGQSHIDWDGSYEDLSSMILTQQRELILTKREKEFLNKQKESK